MPKTPTEIKGLLPILLMLVIGKPEYEGKKPNGHPTGLEENSADRRIEHAQEMLDQGDARGAVLEILEMVEDLVLDQGLELTRWEQAREVLRQGRRLLDLEGVMAVILSGVEDWLGNAQNIEQNPFFKERKIDAVARETLETFLDLLRQSLGGLLPSQYLRRHWSGETQAGLEERQPDADRGDLRDRLRALHRARIQGEAPEFFELYLAEAFQRYGGDPKKVWEEVSSTLTRAAILVKADPPVPPVVVFVEARERLNQPPPGPVAPSELPWVLERLPREMDRFRRLREMSGYDSAHSLEKAVGLSWSVISRYEEGKRELGFYARKKLRRFFEEKTGVSLTLSFRVRPANLSELINGIGGTDQRLSSLLNDLLGWSYAWLVRSANTFRTPPDPLIAPDAFRTTSFSSARPGKRRLLRNALEKGLADEFGQAVHLDGDLRVATSSIADSLKALPNSEKRLAWLLEGVLIWSKNELLRRAHVAGHGIVRLPKTGNRQSLEKWRKIQHALEEGIAARGENLSLDVDLLPQSGLEEVEKLARDWVGVARRASGVASDRVQQAREAILALADRKMLKNLLQDAFRSDKLYPGQAWVLSRNFPGKGAGQELLRIHSNADTGEITIQVPGRKEVKLPFPKRGFLSLSRDLNKVQLVDEQTGANRIALYDYLEEQGVSRDAIETENPSALLQKPGSPPRLWHFPATSRNKLASYSERMEDIFFDSIPLDLLKEQAAGGELKVFSHVHSGDAVLAPADVIAMAENRLIVPWLLLKEGTFRGYLYVPLAEDRIRTAVEHFSHFFAIQILSGGSIAYEGLPEDQKLKILRSYFLVVPIDLGALASAQRLSLPGPAAGLEEHPMDARITRAQELMEQQRTKEAVILVLGVLERVAMEEVPFTRLQDAYSILEEANRQLDLQNAVPGFSGFLDYLNSNLKSREYGTFTSELDILLREGALPIAFQEFRRMLGGKSLSVFLQEVWFGKPTSGLEELPGEAARELGRRGDAESVSDPFLVFDANRMPLISRIHRFSLNLPSAQEPATRPLALVQEGLLDREVVASLDEMGWQVDPLPAGVSEEVLRSRVNDARSRWSGPLLVAVNSRWEETLKQLTAQGQITGVILDSGFPSDILVSFLNQVLALPGRIFRLEYGIKTGLEESTAVSTQL